MTKAVALGRTHGLLKNPSVQLFALAAIMAVTFGLADMAHAATTSTNIFNNLFYKVQDLFYNLRYLAMLGGGIGFVGVMAGGFTGKFPIQKTVVYGGVLIMISLAGAAVGYFGGGSSATGGTGIGTSSASVGGTSNAGTILTDSGTVATY